MPERRKLIASPMHTAGLVLIMLALCLLGAYQQGRQGTDRNLVPSHGGIVPLYVSLIVMEWVLVLYVRAGTRKRGVHLRELVGGRWRGLNDVLLDLALASAFWLIWEGVGRVAHWLLGANHAKTVDTLLPRGPFEIALWILVSMSAGFCEELVFRGYLQKQLRSLTGSGAAAVLGQAIVFGIGHGYQGTKQVVVIVVFGSLYGGLALWRGSIRPGALSHAWSDIFSGILARS
jgi:hypothetical protein